MNKSKNWAILKSIRTQSKGRALRQRCINVHYITHHREVKFSIERGYHDLIESIKSLADKASGVECKFHHDHYYTNVCFTNVTHSKHEEIISYLTLAANKQVKVTVL